MPGAPARPNGQEPEITKVCGVAGRPGFLFSASYQKNEVWMAETMHPELEEDFVVRAHGIIRSWLRGDVEGLVALTGDDADELLPQVTRILGEALLRAVSRE